MSTVTTFSLAGIRPGRPETRSSSDDRFLSWAAAHAWQSGGERSAAEHPKARKYCHISARWRTQPTNQPTKSLAGCSREGVYTADMPQIGPHSRPGVLAVIDGRRAAAVYNRPSGDVDVAVAPDRPTGASGRSPARAERRAVYHVVRRPPPPS